MIYLLLDGFINLGALPVGLKNPLSSALNPKWWVRWGDNDSMVAEPMMICPLSPAVLPLFTHGIWTPWKICNIYKYVHVCINIYVYVYIYINLYRYPIYIYIYKRVKTKHVFARIPIVRFESQKTPQFCSPICISTWICYRTPVWFMDTHGPIKLNEKEQIQYDEMRPQFFVWRRLLETEFLPAFWSWARMHSEDWQPRLFSEKWMGTGVRCILFGMFVKSPIQPFGVKCIAIWFGVPKFQVKVDGYMIYSYVCVCMCIYIYISIVVISRVLTHTLEWIPQDCHEWHWRWTRCGNSTSLWTSASWSHMVPICCFNCSLDWLMENLHRKPYFFYTFLTFRSMVFSWKNSPILDELLFHVPYAIWDDPFNSHGDELNLPRPARGRVMSWKFDSADAPHFQPAFLLCTEEWNVALRMLRLILDMICFTRKP